MMAEAIRAQVEQVVWRSTLASVVDLERSQFLDMAGRVYVELVTRDAGRQAEVSEVFAELANGVDLDIHPKWAIEAIGEPDVARNASGAIVAATIVPVRLRSGQVIAEVQVVVTYLAEQEMERLLGNSSTKQLARAQVESFLRWGGASYWDPTQHPRLEIGRDRALTLYGSLRKSA